MDKTPFGISLNESQRPGDNNELDTFMARHPAVFTSIQSQEANAIPRYFITHSSPQEPLNVDEFSGTRLVASNNQGSSANASFSEAAASLSNSLRLSAEASKSSPRNRSLSLTSGSSRKSTPVTRHAVETRSRAYRAVSVTPTSHRTDIKQTILFSKEEHTPQSKTTEEETIHRDASPSSRLGPFNSKHRSQSVSSTDYYRQSPSPQPKSILTTFTNSESPNGRRKSSVTATRSDSLPVPSGLEKYRRRSTVNSSMTSSHQDEASNTSMRTDLSSPTHSSRFLPSPFRSNIPVLTAEPLSMEPVDIGHTTASVSKVGSHSRRSSLYQTESSVSGNIAASPSTKEIQQVLFALKDHDKSIKSLQHAISELENVPDPTVSKLVASDKIGVESDKSAFEFIQNVSNQVKSLDTALQMWRLDVSTQLRDHEQKIQTIPVEVGSATAEISALKTQNETLFKRVEALEKQLQWAESSSNNKSEPPSQSIIQVVMNRLGVLEKSIHAALARIDATEAEESMIDIPTLSDINPSSNMKTEDDVSAVDILKEQAINVATVDAKGGSPQSKKNGIDESAKSSAASSMLELDRLVKDIERRTGRIRQIEATIKNEPALLEVPIEVPSGSKAHQANTAVLDVISAESIKTKVDEALAVIDHQIKTGIQQIGSEYANAKLNLIEQLKDTERIHDEVKAIANATQQQTETFSKLIKEQNTVSNGEMKPETTNATQHAVGAESNRLSDKEVQKALRDIEKIKKKLLKKVDTAVLEELVRHIATRNDLKQAINRKGGDIKSIEKVVKQTIQKIEDDSHQSKQNVRDLRQSSASGKRSKKQNDSDNDFMADISHEIDLKVAALKRELLSNIPILTPAEKQSEAFIEANIMALENRLRQELKGWSKSHIATILDDTGIATDHALKELRSELNSYAKDRIEVLWNERMRILGENGDEVESAQALTRRLAREFDEKLYLLCSDLSACKSLYAKQASQPFYRCGQWIWKSGVLKMGSGIPWNYQTVNTDPDNFKWDQDQMNIRVAEAGLYEITLAIFTKSKPSVQLVVNGESVLSAINSPSYIVHHSSGFVMDGDGKVEPGTVTGISLIDFMALPSKSTISIHYHGVRKQTLLGHGFVGLRRL